jgi:hypothetical protein
MLEFCVPLSQVRLQAGNPNATIDVAADSMFADLFVDRTGYGGVAFNNDTSRLAVARADNASH